MIELDHANRRLLIDAFLELFWFYVFNVVYHEDIPGWMWTFAPLAFVGGRGGRWRHSS